MRNMDTQAPEVQPQVCTPKVLPHVHGDFGNSQFQVQFLMHAALTASLENPPTFRRGWEAHKRLLGKGVLLQSPSKASSYPCAVTFSLSISSNLQ